MPELTDKQCEAISALALSNMNIAKAARACRIGRGPFLARLERIQRKTGLDPFDFFELHELYEMAGR